MEITSTDLPLNVTNDKTEYFRNKYLANEKLVNDLHRKISFVESVMDLPDIYNYCQILNEKRKKDAAALKLKSEKETAKSHGLTLAEYYSFYEIIRSKNFASDHSMGCNVSVNLEGKNIYRVSTCEEYAKSSKYKASHGSVTVNFTKKEAKKMLLIGGVMTVPVKKIDNHIQQITTISIVGKFYTQLERKTQYLTAGYHSDTIDGCRIWRKQQAIALMAKRSGKEGIELKKELAKYKFVGLNHSTKAGNCEIGTKEFARKHNLNVKMGYNLSYLLNLEPTNPYILRML